MCSGIKVLERGKEGEREGGREEEEGGGVWEGEGRRDSHFLCIGGQVDNDGK